MDDAVRSQVGMPLLPLTASPSIDEWTHFDTFLAHAFASDVHKVGVMVVDIPKGMPGTKVLYGEQRVTTKGSTAKLTMHTTRGAYDIVHQPLSKMNAKCGDLSESFADPEERTTEQWVQRFEKGIERTASKPFSTPRYATNKDLRNATRRKHYQLTAESVFDHINDTGGLKGTVMAFGGIHYSEAFISSGFGTILQLHEEDYNLCALNYIISGAPKVWTTIPPYHHKKLEALIRTEWNDEGEPACDHFVRHKNIYLPHAFLAKHGIHHAQFMQKAGQAVVIFPGTYHQGFNCGPNIAEALNYAQPGWDAAATKPCTRACNGAAGGNNEPIPLDLMRGRPPGIDQDPGKLPTDLSESEDEFRPRIAMAAAVATTRKRRKTSNGSARKTSPDAVAADDDDDDDDDNDIDDDDENGDEMVTLVSGNGRIKKIKRESLTPSMLKMWYVLKDVKPEDAAATAAAPTPHDDDDDDDDDDNDDEPPRKVSKTQPQPKPQSQRRLKPQTQPASKPQSKPELKSQPAVAAPGSGSGQQQDGQALLRVNPAGVAGGRQVVDSSGSPSLATPVAGGGSNNTTNNNPMPPSPPGSARSEIAAREAVFAAMRPEPQVSTRQQVEQVMQLQRREQQEPQQQQGQQPQPPQLLQQQQQQQQRQPYHQSPQPQAGQPQQHRAQQAEQAEQPQQQPAQLTRPPPPTDEQWCQHETWQLRVYEQYAALRRLPHSDDRWLQLFRAQHEVNLEFYEYQWRMLKIRPMAERRQVDWDEQQWRARHQLLEINREREWLARQQTHQRLRQDQARAQQTQAQGQQGQQPRQQPHQQPHHRPHQQPQQGSQQGPQQQS